MTTDWHTPELAVLFEQALGREPTTAEWAEFYQPREESYYQDLARIDYRLSLKREPTEEEWAAFVPADSPVDPKRAVRLLAARLLLEDMGEGLTQASEQLDEVRTRLAGQQERLDEIRAGLKDLQEITSVTVTLPMSWGNANDIIAAVERGARDHDVEYETKVVKTGLLAKRIYFTFTASKLQLVDFLEALKVWSQRAGIGWTSS